MDNNDTFNLNIQNPDTFFDVKEGLICQITNLSQLLHENHPELLLDTPLDKLISQYQESESIVNLCVRIKILTDLIEEIDTYAFDHL